MQKSIQQATQRLKKFLLSQYFSDGFKITIGILLPAFVCYQLGLVEEGIVVSLGALCISIPDTPGPFTHRKNAMLITLVLIFIITLATGLLAHYTWLLAAFITINSFAFSMLHIYGNRAASMGISVLVIMVLGIDQKLTFNQTLEYSLQIAAGGIWYFALSFFTQSLIPYRAAQQLLGECMMKVSEFIETKANFFKGDFLEENYLTLLEKQAEVTELQQQVREILFKTREIVKESTAEGRKLLLSFIDLMDLYEQSMASHYDYNAIQLQYQHHQILPLLHHTIVEIAEEINHLGTAIHNGNTVEPLHYFPPKFMQIKQRLDELEVHNIQVHVLKRILVHIKNITLRLERIYQYQTNTAQKLSPERAHELNKFVTASDISLNLFKANLSFSSVYFRHAIRVAVVCLAAFLFVHFFYEHPYSYWILLTVLVILKPGYSLTKQRNVARLIGTVVGALLGLAILSLFPDNHTRFILLTLFMLLAFSFVRVNYVVSVLFMTPYVLLVFSFTIKNNDYLIIWERIADTFIGSIAAFLGIYFIFPTWESYQLKTVLEKVIQAHALYLKHIVERSPEVKSQSTYRLARKELYVQTAALSNTLQKMMNEPKHKQVHVQQAYRFAVLIHQLSSYFSTLSNLIKPDETINESDKRWIRSVYFNLKDAVNLIQQQPQDLPEIIFKEQSKKASIQNDFLMLMHKTTGDIKKELQQFHF